MNSTQTPVSIITGFLGSGKTTLINHLLNSSTMANTAVLVNEFGAIAIDNDLIQNSDETVIQLGNGCLCCSIKDDLAITLHELTEQRKSRELPQFEKVLIETTGLANAGPIIDIILNDPLIQESFILDRVITTVDSINGKSSLDLHAESVEQAALADLIVLTKADLIPESQDRSSIDLLISRLRALNPAATIKNKEIDTIDAETVFAPLDHETLVKYVDPEKWQEDNRNKQQGHDHGKSIGRHEHHLQCFCIVREKPLSLEFLHRFRRKLGEIAGPNLLRVKGFAHIFEKPAGPVVVQGAQEIVHEVNWLDSWPSPDHRTRIVFIGWDLDQPSIEAIFDENTERI